jgi:hypothetical protein
MDDDSISTIDLVTEMSYFLAQFFYIIAQKVFGCCSNVFYY